jgi:hypothetical protein
MVDIGFVLLTWFLLRLLPRLEARQIRMQRMPEQI